MGISLNQLKNMINKIMSKINSQLDEKANKNETQSIQQQVNNLVLGAVGDGNNAEVVQARGEHNLLYENIESRITSNEAYSNFMKAKKEKIECTNYYKNNKFETITISNMNNTIYNVHKNFGKFSETEITKDGITVNIDSEGVFTLNGTASSMTIITISNTSIPFLRNIKYTGTIYPITEGEFNIAINFLKTDYSSKVVYNFAKSGIGDLVLNSSKIILHDTLDILKTDIYIISGTYDNFKFKLQFEPGDSSTDWEAPSDNTIIDTITSAGSIISGNNLTLISESNFTIEKIVEFESIEENLKSKINENTLKINNLKLSDIKDDIGLFGNKVILDKKKLPYTDKTLINEQVLGETSNTLENWYPSIIDGEINNIFRYDCPKMLKGSLYPREDFIFQNTLTKYGYSVEFFADCKSIEVRVLNESTRMLLVVDGVICSDLIRLSDSNGAVRYNKFIFTEKKKRHFKIGLYDGFGGIYTDGEITPVIEKRPFMICEGDSLVYGVSSSVAYNKITSIFANVAQSLGWDFHNDGVGSTGYVATGSGVEGTDFIGRLPEIQELQPDIFICMGGLNDRNVEIKDNSEGTTVLKDAIDLYWKTVKETLKTKYIIGVSPFCPQIAPEGLAPLENIAEYVRLACLKNAIPYIDTIHRKVYDAFGNVLMDSSYLGNIITSENIDTYIMDDNTHLTIEGDIYLGLFLTQCIYLILNDNYGICLDETYKPLI